MSTLRVKLHRSPALTVRRTDVKKDRLVYLLVASKPQRYQYGHSRIVYIGTTRRGLRRIAASAAQRADDVLGLHGVKHFDVRIVTCQGRQHVKTWHKLERALLLRFREKYGRVPALNQRGAKMRETDEFRLFTRKRLDAVLADVES